MAMSPPAKSSRASTPRSSPSPSGSGSASVASNGQTITLRCRKPVLTNNDAIDEANDSAFQQKVELLNAIIEDDDESLTPFLWARLKEKKRKASREPSAVIDATRFAKKPSTLGAAIETNPDFFANWLVKNTDLNDELIVKGVSLDSSFIVKLFGAATQMHPTMRLTPALIVLEFFTRFANICFQRFGSRMARCVEQGIVHHHSGALSFKDFPWRIDVTGGYFTKVHHVPSGSASKELGKTFLETTPILDAHLDATAAFIVEHMAPTKLSDLFTKGQGPGKVKPLSSQGVVSQLLKECEQQQATKIADEEAAKAAESVVPDDSGLKQLLDEHKKAVGAAKMAKMHEASARRMGEKKENRLTKLRAKAVAKPKPSAEQH